ncbi:hypothetical protein [Clostridium perfringens]|uniref:hypothetical protein n=1 Tax=Clostridium perfringens TaxID=1502 RepID=UPI0029704896|nr:hypothetical protein [Clostridium perfringens]MDM0781757.1 hypothetical protein [Clostridium perfringens]MDM0867352.1 hypothetical protein [Clostridium perfringens]MDM0875256.1 hypothetical protein [Clostridium perfringens]MDM0878165.1 hypothetical protein [Clostridium perfringens]
MTKETILQGLEKLNSSIGEYLEIRDDILDNDYIEVIGDISKTINFFKKINEMKAKRQLLSFIKGFNPNNNPTEEEINKLIKYVNSEKKAQFISDTLSNILFAKSRKGCMIIGSMLGYLKDNLNELPVEYIICVSGLTDLFDHDIENIKYIYRWANNEIEGQKKRNKNTGWFYITKKFKDLAKANDVEISSLLISIEKLVSLQYLQKEYEVDFGGELDVESPSADTYESYKLTESGILLCGYIFKLNL